MEHVAKIGLVDEAGQPFGAHIDSALRGLLPRLQRQFPTLKDETVIVEILEEAGRKVAAHERRSGPIEKLHAYAWVTVRSVATSEVRRGSMRIARATLAGDEGADVLGTLRSNQGTPEQIEADILIQEVLAQLTPEEQLICIWKRVGFSSREIAKEQGTTVERVNTFFHRVKRKVREALRPPNAKASSSATTHRAKARSA
jgi:DNA-directed RNA polymerase specialized sigma24 family protein